MDSPSPIDARQDAILKALRDVPNGIPGPQLQETAGLQDLNVQVFRRLINDLVARGLVHRGGNTKARRYWLEGGNLPARERPLTAPVHGASAASLGPLSGHALGWVGPPLSPEASVLQGLLRQPLQERKPLSYQRAFLDNYRPNQSFYLPEATRDRLQSFGKHQSAQEPAGTYARQILQRLLIDLSWNSSRLEGNTYSLLDTERLIEQGEATEGRDALETQMILNHKAAIEYLVESAGEISVDATTVMNLHGMLTENLLTNPMDEGRLRSSAVRISGTTYIPLGNPQLIEECFRQVLHTAFLIQDPFEQSFFLLIQLPYLQPFMDGNKRTARLAANIPFIRLNYCPITFVEVPKEVYTEGMLAVYEFNQVDLLRDVFVWAYERSCARYGAVRASMGEPDPFRLRYRSDIKQVVAEIVRGLVAESALPACIQAYAEAHLPQEAWPRFQAVVESEVAALHQGNYARYQLRPSEFKAWIQRKEQPPA